MTEAFASAVAVTVPILVLAAGAEVRAVREAKRAAEGGKGQPAAEQPADPPSVG